MSSDKFPTPLKAAVRCNLHPAAERSVERAIQARDRAIVEVAVPMAWERAWDRALGTFPTVEGVQKALAEILGVER